MGKYSILVVFCLSVMLAVILPNVHSLGHRSVENFVGYASRTQSHHLALSGANTAATRLFLDPSWRGPVAETNLAGGSYRVAVTEYDSTKLRITSTGSFEGAFDTVTVLLQPGSFARYAYYSKVEGSITWITGDTVWGPFHTQDVMKTAGTPVIKGMATNLKGTNPSPSAARFDAGYLTNVSVDLPLDLKRTENGAATGGRIVPTGDLWITFLGDRLEWKTSASGPASITPIRDYAPNGVILVRDGSIHVSGMLDGRVTLCALGDASSSRGNIYIVDDLRYAKDPRTHETDNILGLIADNHVIIRENAANNSSVVIQGSVFCRKGGLTAENYATRVVSGTIDLLGGIIQYQRGAVGTFSSVSGVPVIKSGFKKNYRYDTRFYLDAPPFYPWTGSYQIVSWIE